LNEQSLRGIIAAQAKKNCRKLVFLSLLIAALCLVIAFAVGINIPALLKNPVGLRSAFEGQKGGYVTVTTDWLFDIDYYETTTSDGRTSTTGYYGVISFDDGFIVCLLPKNRAGELFTRAANGNAVTVSGRMQEFSSHDKGLIGSVVREVRQSGAEISSEDFSPYLLEAKQDHLGFHRLIAGVVALFVLATLARGLFNLRFLSDHRKHKLYRALDALGDGERLERDFDAQMASGRLIYQCRGLYISPDVILCTGKGWARRTADLVWAYRKTVQHRTNGIPTGKTFGLVMAFKRQDGVKSKNDMYEAALSKDREANDAIAALERGLPAVLLGYDAGLERLYRKDYEIFETSLRRHAAERARQNGGEPEAEEGDMASQDDETADESFSQKNS
jgi:hypothetical protein